MDLPGYFLSRRFLKETVMDTKQFDCGAKPCAARSNLYLRALSIFASSVHHSSHHEHLAH
jgi:hypothetical protein